MAQLSRRAFVRTGLAAGALASTGSLSLQALQATAAKKPPPTGSPSATPESRSPASPLAPAA